MVRIFICDDEAGERRKIENSLLCYIASHPERNITYCIFSSPYELLEEAERTGTPDIVMLDIYMPGMLGIDLARTLSSMREKCNIIFITSSSDFALDAFSIHASDYIKKPYTEEKFDSSLERVIKTLEDRRCILLPSSGRIHRVMIDDIIYMETIDKKRTFFLSDGSRISSWLSLNELEEKVLTAKGLVKCGSSFIINLSHAKCFQNNNILMDNGTLVPVPRRLRTQMKEQYFNYYLSEAGIDAGV